MDGFHSILSKLHHVTYYLGVQYTPTCSHEDQDSNIIFTRNKKKKMLNILEA